MSEPIYIERWEVSGNLSGDRLDIAYTKSSCPTYEILDMLRDGMAEVHNCTLKRLLRTDVIEEGADDETD